MPDDPARVVGVLGAGYVGLTSAACLAHLGLRVRCVDLDAPRVARLREGLVDLHEPGLAALVRSGLDAGRLSFHTGADAVAGADVALICVPTPSLGGGGADVSAVTAARDAAAALRPPPRVIAVKSTVPPGTCAALAARGGPGVVCNPEFLREGRAVEDFLHPDRIVVGGDDAADVDAVAGLYSGLRAPLLTASARSAELAKCASNALLALKTSFVNELAALCERVGADVDEVAGIAGADPRIGGHGLHAGPGWGGSCLPKDTRSLASVAEHSGVRMPVLEAAMRSNTLQELRTVDAVRRAVGAGSLRGARLALLGLAFKEGTGDLRSSPSMRIAERLAAHGAHLTAYDPAVSAADVPEGAPVRVSADPVTAAARADAVVVLTAWPQFRDLDWPAMARTMHRARCVDARRLLDPAVLERAGFRVVRIGSAREAA